MQRIKEVMTPNPQTCSVDHPVTCALEIMHQKSCGAVPIVDKQNVLKGIVTDRDIALCILKLSKMPDQIQVQECGHMGQLITIKPEEDIHRAVALMEEHQVRRLPVVDDAMHCIGIVAQADIVLKDQNTQEVAELVQEVSKKRPSIGANP